MTAPDTYDNQREWPQPGSQKTGCGWPLISVTGLFCLSSGTLLHAAHGCWKSSEARLFALLRRTLRPGDFLVADRGFWSFANLAFLPMRSSDFIVRLVRPPISAIPLRHLGGRYAKRIDWRKGQRLGKDDRHITMKRPADKDASRVMSTRLWKSLPRTITMRQVRVHISGPAFTPSPCCSSPRWSTPCSGRWKPSPVFTRAAFGSNSTSTTARPPCRHRTCALSLPAWSGANCSSMPLPIT